MKKNNKNAGFTLIELLVVMTIIAILAALSTFGLQNSFENARDAQRKSDMRQYANALETFANTHSSLYPGRNVGVGVQASVVTCVTDLGLSGCPEDPKYVKDPGNWVFYKYQSDGTTGLTNATRYVLWARLEESTNAYWVVCSNGKSGRLTSVSTSTGTCPLP